MIVVETPTLFTAQCLVNKRSDADRGPYIDLLRDFDMDHQGRMYVSKAAVEEFATLLGLPSEAQTIKMLDRIDELEAQVREQEAELASLREFERSAQYTMEHMGQKVRQKPGRKPKELVKE